MYNFEHACFIHDQLAVVILPIIGIGVFLWWAGKDVVQDTVSSFPSQLYFVSHVNLMDFFGYGISYG